MSTVLSEPGPAAPVDAQGLAPAAAPQFALPGMAGAQLARNPQLPEHPLGAYTDALYEAQVAQLRQQIAKQYNDVLQQLGYTDDQGNFIPGQVEIDANKQRSILGRNVQLADEAVTQQAQQQGTLFSGLRGTQQARAEYPFQSAIADLGVSVPKQLTDLYGQGTDLISQFNTQHNLMLAEAAQRASAAIAGSATSGMGPYAPAIPPDGGGAAGATPPAGLDVYHQGGIPGQTQYGTVTAAQPIPRGNAWAT